MQSSLFSRRTIRRWWKLAMIEATPSPVSTRERSAVVRDSSLCCREGGTRRGALCRSSPSTPSRCTVGGRRRRCGGRTILSPNPHCWRSWCTTGTTPCAYPTVRASGYRCEPLEVFASCPWREYEAIDGRFWYT
jgi:hypothetical protein